jgi:hypothetical protein
MVELEYGPTVDGSEIVGPRRKSGLIDALRLTVLLKPFVPITDIVKVVEDPLDTDWDAGIIVMVKSGGGGGAVTVTNKVTVRVWFPLVPVTATV